MDHYTPIKYCSLKLAFITVLPYWIRSLKATVGLKYNV